MSTVGKVATEDWQAKNAAAGEAKRSKPAILMIAYTNYDSDPRVIRAAEAAIGADFAVDVLVLRRRGQSVEETVRGVRVLRVAQERYRGSSRARYFLAYFEFFLRCFAASTRLFFTRRYRVIHVNNIPDALVFAVLVPRLLGAKIILDIHDPMPETLGSKFAGGGSGWHRLLVWAEKLSVAFAHQTITVSEPLRSGVLLKRGYARERVTVVANFADEDIFTLMTYPPLNGTLRFAFHGTILERNGLRTLVDAIARLRHRERVAVRIIGEGDFSETLADLIRARDLQDTIEFLNRAFPLREIPRLLSDCHVGLVPLDMSAVANFALPLKLVEYTCLGMPSITVTNAAIRHYFRPDECLFFESGDADALARAVEGVIEEPERLLEYRKRLAGARERLQWSKERQKYVDILHGLVER